MSVWPKIRLMLFLFISFVLCPIGFVYSHQPHDVIDTIAVSPVYHLDGTVFVVVDEVMLKKSSDEGHTWKLLVNGLNNKHPFSSISLSSNFYSDQTLFVATDGSGIYKSINGGSSFFTVNNSLENLKVKLIVTSPNFHEDQVVLAVMSEGGMNKTANGAEDWHRVMSTEYKISFVAYSPDFKNDRTIFAGDSSGTLYYSTDKGESWQIWPVSFHGAISTITPSPNFSTDGTIFVGTFGDGIYKTTDRGHSFFPVSSGITDKSITSIAVSPSYAQDSIVYATSATEAVFKSNNGGATWQKNSTGIYYREQGELHYKLLQIAKDSTGKNVLFLAAFEGLFKSILDGTAWLELESIPPGSITSISVSPAFKDDTSIMISTYGGGIYRSTDAGDTWQINNIGIERPFFYDLCFSPHFPVDHTVFALQLGFLAKSTNSGNSWQLHVISPLSNVFPTVVAISPDFAYDRTLYLGSRYNGVYRSTDGGETWDNVFTESKFIYSIAISPDFTNSGAVYVGTFSDGIFKTQDGGDTWQPINNGLTSLERVTVMATPSEGSTFFAGTSDGLFKTITGGGYWEKLTGSSAVEHGLIETLSISPNHTIDKSLLVSVHGLGLFKSTDSGSTWQMIAPQLLNNNYSLRKIEFSPSYAIDNTLYASSDTELFISADAGNSWKMINRPVRYENSSEFVHFLGGGWRGVKNRFCSSQNGHFSANFGDLAVLNFVGSGISWIGTRSDRQGIANVYVDGVFMTRIDQFSPEPQFLESLYSTDDLEPGPHTLVIEVTDDKNSLSLHTYTTVDAFDVLQ